MLYMFAIFLEFKDQTKGSKLKATRAAWLKKGSGRGFGSSLATQGVVWRQKVE